VLAHGEVGVQERGLAPVRDLPRPAAQQALDRGEDRERDGQGGAVGAASFGLDGGDGLGRYVRRQPQRAPSDDLIRRVPEQPLGGRRPAPDRAVRVDRVCDRVGR